MNYASYKKLFKELKNGIDILVGQMKTVKCCVWINNSITAWPTLILMLFLSSLANLLGPYRMHILFKKKNVDIFEI